MDGWMDRGMYGFSKWDEREQELKAKEIKTVTDR